MAFPITSNSQLRVSMKSDLIDARVRPCGLLLMPATPCLSRPLCIGHVNNVQYLRYAETSRIWYFRRLTPHVPRNRRKEWDEFLTPRGEGLILKAAHVEFLLVGCYYFMLALKRFSRCAYRALHTG